MISVQANILLIMRAGKPSFRIPSVFHSNPLFAGFVLSSFVGLITQHTFLISRYSIPVPYPRTSVFSALLMLDLLGGAHADSTLRWRHQGTFYRPKLNFPTENTISLCATQLDRQWLCQFRDLNFSYTSTSLNLTNQLPHLIVLQIFPLSGLLYIHKGARHRTVNSSIRSSSSSIPSHHPSTGSIFQESKPFLPH